MKNIQKPYLSSNSTIVNFCTFFTFFAVLLQHFLINPIMTDVLQTYKVSTAQLNYLLPLGILITVLWGAVSNSILVFGSEEHKKALGIASVLPFALFTMLTVIFTYAPLFSALS